MTAIDHGRVSRADLEAKMRELKGEVEGVAGSASQYLIVGAVVGIVVVVGLAYAFGRKRGRKRSTVVEVRRV